MSVHTNETKYSTVIAAALRGEAVLLSPIDRVDAGVKDILQLRSFVL
ncbi:MAG: hypothetical protein AVDCRST_MAG87-584 [uncultured Thermomicrobiales bacterium]|uniref:Uncharacterized protein n=1 Tax=uncultured Thermomicrobiales bacterium TaxID=1645740 RepID=A0A6J4UD79_9BACT|nr:MAG: hypothetical protein AVDCRST_MAG87-584 [uncultured Thermomicrobiales bacterium]